MDKKLKASIDTALDKFKVQIKANVQIDGMKLSLGLSMLKRALYQMKPEELHAVKKILGILAYLQTEDIEDVLEEALENISEEQRKFALVLLGNDDVQRIIQSGIVQLLAKDLYELLSEVTDAN